MRVLFLSLLLLMSSAVKANANTPSTFQEDQCVPQAVKVCIDESEKIVEGFQIKECWKYKEVLRCTGKEENHCNALESNRGCNEIKGSCLSQSPTGLCNHYDKTFACGNNSIRENQEVQITDAEFNVLKDEKDLSGCDEETKNKYCEVTEENCLEKEETRNINGKEVHKECWKWDRKYNCRTDTKVSECKALQDQGCRELTRECIHQEGDRCEHYVVQYECDNKTSQTIDCQASKFCIGDVCEEKERNANKNFGLAASYLGVLSQVQKDGESCGCNKEKDPDCNSHKVEEEKCKLFKGEGFQCKRSTSQYNCCSEKGFIRPLLGCTEQEKELGLKQQAKVCHHVHKWKGKGAKKFITKNSFCCFNSALARIIQVQGRAQLGLDWGDRKNPDCRALTLSEIQSLDFSKIKFEELYEDMREKAQKDFGLGAKDIEEKLKGYQAGQNNAQSVIKDKMKRFYEKQ